jgi:hypothetical protein
MDRQPARGTPSAAATQKVAGQVSLGPSARFWRVDQSQCTLHVLLYALAEIGGHSP